MDLSRLYFVIMCLVVSALAGWLTIPQIIVISKRKRLFDEINARKVHTQAVSRLGGLSFFPAAMFAFCLSLGMRYYIKLDLGILFESIFLKDIMFLFSGLFVVFMIGLADDLIGVNYRYKFLAQIISGGMLVFAGLTFTNLHGLFGANDIYWWIGAVLTLLYTVFVINAFNLIDGVDGLCSGISSIVLFSLGAWFIYSSYYVYAMISFAMLGTVLVFFMYNFFGKRLKVFMGDTGSLTLGYIIVFLTLVFVRTSSQSNLIDDQCMYVIKNPLSLILGLLFVPTYDTIRVFVSRISRGRSPFEPDKTHLHHKLLDVGFSHRRCTFVILIKVIFFMLLNVLLSEVLMLNINLVLIIDVLSAFTMMLIINRSRAKRSKASQSCGVR